MTLYRITGSRSTFEFPSRVNLSGSRLYCITRTARTADKLSRYSKDTQRCNNIDGVRLQIELTFTEGSKVRECLSFSYSQIKVWKVSLWIGHGTKYWVTLKNTIWWKIKYLYFYQIYSKGYSCKPWKGV